MPKLFSSRRVIQVLERQGFVFISQRGSHAKYRKTGPHTFTAIVPVGKKEIPHGTFRSIVRQSGLQEENFE
ncbi:MAG: type II toxin-antitoxin system HicA family toxin [Candidatus Sungbacteria bacterium]|nr:type II toxin-antitoxin system HicA family toxin [Candidatus Sungbacteria bacterium]